MRITGFLAALLIVAACMVMVSGCLDNSPGTGQGLNKQDGSGGGQRMNSQNDSGGGFDGGQHIQNGSGYAGGQGGFNDSEYVTAFNPSGFKQSTDAYPVGNLTEAEAADILFMAEEEKLARDAYLYYYDKWGQPVFSNIASAEETHMDSMVVLIERYSLVNPVEGEVRGVFENPELQALYDGLVTSGSVSETDALKNGALIEEIDIIDLDDAIAGTDKQDIILIYENLRRGSENHLRSFVSNLERNGISYLPQELSEDEYDLIMQGDIDRGQRTL
ncbi:DUF2202 domain-containing protein [Methanoplanus endosymbiosus]|uniref:DUF2202 domain-containing protein n=1 Tax=Methanoplanus endosymbiosus TaxID=33865 RepID=A0A9E7PN97_9EURY|nr:DUF2202 domain-containing protein [Methanoplanus endosymbiosus]UUX93394.1 DUF2202 domain-containing protein [Methanoplanus endosymbiosus]